MSVTHKLKTQAEYFEAVQRGEKKFEIRRNDRGYQKGDILKLQKLKAGETRYYQMDGYGTDAKPVSIDVEVTYILSGGQFGLDSNWVVMSIEPFQTAV